MRIRWVYGVEIWQQRTLVIAIYQVSVQHPTSAVNVTLLAFAAERRAAAAERCGRAASIDISCPPGAQQQTHSSAVQQANDGTEAQTDRRTPDRYIEPAAYSMQAVPVKGVITRFERIMCAYLLLIDLHRVGG